jgi:hypothetical protein
MCGIIGIIAQETSHHDAGPRARPRMSITRIADQNTLKLQNAGLGGPSQPTSMT